MQLHAYYIAYIALFLTFSTVAVTKGLTEGKLWREKIQGNTQLPMVERTKMSVL